MKTTLILLLILLTSLGCGKKHLQPRIDKTTLTHNMLKDDSNTTKVDTSFHEENMVEEDATTKVFENCFKTGIVKVQKSCKKRIDNFLKSTSLKDKRKIIIEVHTDKGGSEKKNLAISIQRAKNTAGSLYYKEYKNSEVYYNGFGESKLIYDNETKEANQKNRRVLVKLRSKNFAVDTKKYTLFKKSKTKKTAFKIHQKRAKNNLSQYTGEADIGWIYFGKPSLAKKFTMSCKQDKPMKVKHKSISKSKKDEFLSTFYNRKITTSFENKELEIYPIYIYENGKLPVINPILTFKQKKKQTFRFQTTVNSYRGKNGILYRVFVNGKKQVSCVDLVISYKDDKVSYGRVYMKNGKEFSLKAT